jgi:oxalate decarboxylase
LPHSDSGCSQVVPARFLTFLEVWRTDRFSDVSLRPGLAFTPYNLVEAHLHIDRSVLKNIPTRKTPVVPA